MPSYYRYTIRGKHSADAAIGMLGSAGAHGLIVRVDSSANDTHVLVAAETAPGPAHAAPAHVGAATPVSEAEVLHFP